MTFHTIFLIIYKAYLFVCDFFPSYLLQRASELDMCLHFFTELSKIMKLNMDWVRISTYFPYVPFEILNGTNFCMLVTKHSAGCCVCPFESQHSARISLSSFNARTTPQILSNIHQLGNRIIFVHCHFWVWSATFFLLLVSRLMPLVCDWRRLKRAWQNCWWTVCVRQWGTIWIWLI